MKELIIIITIISPCGLGAICCLLEWANDSGLARWNRIMQRPKFCLKSEHVTKPGNQCSSAKFAQGTVK
jgi:hypothetical protein